jgi:drug/metabolite transporter (DMT)-like permease
MTWQIFILLHALFSALQVLQFRALARVKSTRRAGLAINAVAFSALYVSGLIVLPLLGKVDNAAFFENWYIFFVSALLFDVALYLMFKGLTHLESATASVLGTSSALFVVIMASFFYGERLSASQLIGIAILIPCIWYVLLLARQHHRLLNFKNLNWVHGFWFILASSFCLAIAHILEKEILTQTNAATYVAYGWLLQAAGAWGLYILFGRHAKETLKNYKLVRSALQLGVLRAATGIFFVFALVESNSVSLVTVIANFRIIIVAVLAGWLLNEKKFYYKKLAAAALSVLGLSIIFWN